MKTRLHFFLGLALVFWLAGCSTMKSVGDWVAPEKEPTMAHVHVGHAMTSWKQTPKNMGLFIVAEKEATVAFIQASMAVRKQVALEQVKQHIRHTMHAIDPAIQSSGPGLGFGQKRALTEAVSHIAFAGQSKDASENLKAFVGDFSNSAVSTIERCDLILALAQDVLQAGAINEALALAEEIIILTRANIEGVNPGDTPETVTDPADFGLNQLRGRIEAMIGREDPPYEPAPRRYLLGVVRLPNGDWTYRWLAQEEDDDEDGNGGGGY